MKDNMPIIAKAKDVIQDSMMEYSAYVLLHRAIPDMRDGLKPSQRRVLITMHRYKTYNLAKSANITGRVMEIHPHGDSYGTIVNMVQEDRHQVPSLTGKGNWGQYTSKDLTAAAARYTEVKLSELGKEMTDGINKNLVNMVPNFDGSVMMPEVLPVTFPGILTSASFGIGVGFSSSILPYNIKELSQVIAEYVKTGEIRTIAPDFPTGGYIVEDQNAFEEIMSNGRGSVVLRGKAHIEDNFIYITEVPYGIKREQIIDKIVDLADKKKFPEIVDVKDLTDFDGLSVEIELRKNANPEIVLERLYQTTQLQTSVSSNMNMIINDLPRVSGVRETIIEWVAWRRSIVEREIKNDYRKVEKQIMQMEALQAVLSDLDEVIEIIRKSKEDQIIPKLMRRFEIKEEEAEYIANMKLRNINNGYILKQTKALKDTHKKRDELFSYIGNERKLNKRLVDDMIRIADKFGVERQTKYFTPSTKKLKVLEKVKADLKKVDNSEVKIFATKLGYLYKVKPNADLLESKLRVGDEILQSFKINNDQHIFAFFESRDIAVIQADSLGEIGTYIPLMFDKVGEEIINYASEQTKEIAVMFEGQNGIRLPMSVFGTNRRLIKDALCRLFPIHTIVPINDEPEMISINTTKGIELLSSDQFPFKKSRLGKGARIIKGETI